MALRPQFWGKEYGYNNTVLVCLSVAVINTIAKDKYGERVCFSLHLLFRGKSGQELKAGAVGKAAY